MRRDVCAMGVTCAIRALVHRDRHTHINARPRQLNNNESHRTIKDKEKSVTHARKCVLAN